MPRGNGETEHEVAGAAWHTPHEIKGLDLHPAFAKSWDTVRRSKGPVTAAAASTEGCGHCGDFMSRHRQADVMYHQSPAWNRKSIGRHGLVSDMSEDEIGKGTYMSPRASEPTDEDTWRVDTRGMTLHPDDPGNMHEFRDVGGSYWTQHDIPADRLTLHRAGTSSYWDEHNRHEAASGYDVNKRSAMISLDVPPGVVHTVDNGVDDGHHVTICYLGGDVDDDSYEHACERAAEAAARMKPLSGTLSGIGTFPPSKSSENKVPAFVPVNVPGIHDLRNALADLSASEHKDYKPHVTLGYYEHGEPLPSPHPEVPVHFTHLSVHRGKDEVRHFPLGG
jgi:2'-5' RNA ligase